MSEFAGSLAKRLAAWRRVWIAFFLVAGLLGSADRARAQSPRAFPLRHVRAAEVEPLVAQLLAGDAGAKLAVDAANNALVLTGSPAAERIVADALAALDRPAPAAQAEPPQLVRAYPYRGDESSLGPLRAALTAWGPSQILLDPRTGQLLVRGSQGLHEELARRLGTAAAQPFAGQPSTDVSTIVPLQGVRCAAVIAEAERALPRRLKAIPGSNPASPSALILESRAGEVRILIDDAGNRFIVTGPVRGVEQAARLLTGLADPRGATRARSLGGAPWNKVQEAVGAYRGETPGAAPAPTRPQAAAARQGVQRVAYQEPPAEIPPPPGEAAVQPPLEFDDPEAAARLRELGTRVDVEILPDLDVILLRGNPRDVDEVMRIIEEIERISAQATPQIEVLPLAHASSARIAETITANQLNLLGSLPGSARVTAIARPNSLLVVGWGEALKAMKDLVAKLDQPVSPEAQLKVYGLHHASAAALEATVRDFFQRRSPGAASDVIVAADPRTNALVVHASPNDLQEIDLMVARLDVNRGPEAHELRVFRLHNSLAADLAPVLQQALTGTERPPSPTASAAANQARATVLKFLTIDAQGRRIIESGLLQDVRITPDPRTNTLLVAAPGQAMELLAALISQLDAQPAALAQIKVFRIVNGDASELVEMLRSLLGSPQATVVGPQLAGAEGEGALAALRFSVDNRTNSIIASGSAGDLAIVEAILLRLDDSDVQERKSTVFRLKNSPAPQVAEAINEFLRSERLVQQAAPGSVSAFRQIESEVVVVPETISNSLILSATPRFYDEIRQLIEELDAQPPQVLIQVLIAEVVLDNIDEFGVELGLQDSLLFDRSLASDVVETANGDLLSTTLAPGFNFNNFPLGNNGAPSSLANSDKVGGQGLSNFSLGRINNQLGFGGLVLSASSESVSVLIRALKVKGRLDVLSRPQVMTLDNQPAFIQVGQRVPQVVSTSLTAFGQVNSIELENIGLILGVRPRISPEGLVVMEIDAEKSDIDTSSPGIPIAIAADGQTITSPIYNTTLAQTAVSAASGQTIMLGGLITKSNERFSRRVPYLSDIPVVGALFRYDFQNLRRTELLIILTPHVVRSPEDADRLKQIEAARMSWCLADVQKIQGECGLCAPGQCHHCDSAAEIIYPDVDPHGIGLPYEGQIEIIPGGTDVPVMPEVVPTPQPTLAPPDLGPALGPQS